MKNLSLRVIAPLILFAACSQQPKSDIKYFDFDRLLDEQISELSQRKRVLDKIADLDGLHSDTTFLPSTHGWENELEAFRELEMINKPAFRTSYRVEDSVRDTKSNLLIRRYTGSSVPLSQLDFYYQNEFSQIKRIEARVSEKNIIFNSKRTLTLEFEEGTPGHPLLTGYSIRGSQKMFLRDTVYLSMEGQIDW